MWSGGKHRSCPEGIIEYLAKEEQREAGSTGTVTANRARMDLVWKRMILIFLEEMQCLGVACHRQA